MKLNALIQYNTEERKKKIKLFSKNKGNVVLDKWVSISHLFYNIDMAGMLFFN